MRSVAAERDFVVREMREMAEQCQSVAEEFQSMADYSERLVKEISEVSMNILVDCVWTNRHSSDLSVRPPS